MYPRDSAHPAGETEALSCARPEDPDVADLQPQVDDVPNAWVDKFESTREARYLERLAADQELVLELQWTKFAGPGWDRLSRALIEYGFQVFLAWTLTGEVFARCRAKNFGGRVMYEPRHVTKHEDAREIAIDTVGFGIVKFRNNVLLRNRWSATEGASLKTYFVGQGLIQFVGIYRSWLRMQAPLSISLDDPAMPSADFAFRGGETAEDGAMRAFAAEDALRTLSDVETRQILALVELGYSHKEIAELIGLPSAKAVEAKLYRHRKRIERREAQPE